MEIKFIFLPYICLYLNDIRSIGNHKFFCDQYLMGIFTLLYICMLLVKPPCGQHKCKNTSDLHLSPFATSKFLPKKWCY